MNVERDSFVFNLTKNTQLLTDKAIDMKNILCIRALLNIAVNFGNQLGTAWKEVLEIIMELNFLLEKGVAS